MVFDVSLLFSVFICVSKQTRSFWIFSSIKCFDLSYFKYLLIFLLNPTSCYGLFSKINPTAAFVVSTHAFTGGPLYLCQQPLTFATDVCLFFFTNCIKPIDLLNFSLHTTLPKVSLDNKTRETSMCYSNSRNNGVCPTLDSCLYSGSRSVLLFLLFLPVY